MSALGFVAVILITSVLFLFWGGPIWSAPRESSHVARFLVSYLAAVPLVFLAHQVRGTGSTRGAITAVGVIWAVKMVTTAVLYEGLVQRPGRRVVSAATEAKAAPPLDSGYDASTGPFATRRVSGKVVDSSGAVPGAVVMLLDPRSGAALPPRTEVPIQVGNGTFDSRVYLARTSDALHIASSDGALHTAHFRGERSNNVPLNRAGTAVTLEGLEAGLQLLTCDTHPGERAAVVVVDHPYAVVTDTLGRFTFEAAPTTAATLAVVALRASSVLRLELPIPDDGESLELSIDSAKTIPF